MFVRLGWNSVTRLITIMRHTTLLIVRSSGKPVGLASFRFELDSDEGIEIVHLWELLIEESMRNRGIETYLLNTVTDIATHFNMRKIVLSVFKSNITHLQLYEEQGFSVNKKAATEEHYFVLSKPNPSFHKYKFYTDRHLYTDVQ